MIIELYGLPGSGKSTWARSVAREHAVPVVHVRTLPEVLFYASWYVVRHPLRSCVLLFFVFRFGATPFLTYFKFMNVFLQYNAKRMKAERMGCDCILDQGHHQAVVSLFERVVSVTVLERLLKYVPAPDILLIFDTPLEVRRSRLSDRWYSDTRDALTKEEKQQWLTATEENHQRFLKIASALPYMRIDNDTISYATLRTTVTA